MSTTKLYKKLLEIQKEVEHFNRDAKGHNYSYTTGDQVLNKIRPLMNKKGLLLKQEIIEVENKKVDYETKYGNKAEMFTSAKQLFTWIDSESGETLEVKWHGNGMNDWDKGLGSSLTYSERYFLLKFFHVPTDEDDPDRKGYNKKSSSNGTPPKNQDEEEKEWLNKTKYNSDELTPQWKNAVKGIRSGKFTAQDIFTSYKVNKENRAELEEIERAPA